MDDPIQNAQPPETDLSGLTGDPSGMAGLQQTPPMPPEAQLQAASTALQPETQGADMGQMQTTPQPNLPQLPPRPPGTGVASQPVDRKQYFREMLGNFLYSVGQGLSASGTGPGANARGAGAALTAIPQRDVMMRQLQIQQEQADAMKAYHQAQAGALQAGAETIQVPVYGPDGKVQTNPDGSVQTRPILQKDAGKYFQSTGAAGIRGAATTTAATTKANAGGVTISDDIAKTLGLSPDLVGKSLNPAQIKALTTKISQPNVLGLIAKANKGDADAKAILDTKQDMDKALMDARGNAFGKGRLWSLQTVFDPETGETRFDTGFGILDAQRQGKTIMPVGKLPQDKIVAVQQLQSEATPALKNFEGAIKAFDNPNDRAIFARVMKGSGDPVRGDESTWMGNIFNQAAKENLSPEGKLIATQYGPRLAETMGRLRSTLGLQATDQAMALTLRLIPGGSTPDASTAKGQLGQIREMIDQAVNIPAFGKKGGPSAASKTGGVKAGRYKFNPSTGQLEPM